MNHKFIAEHTLSTANADSLQLTNFQHRTLIRYRTHIFDSKRWFVAADTLSVANVNSLQTTQSQFRQQITSLLQNTLFRQQMLIRCRQLNFGSESWFAINNIISTANTISLQITELQQQTLIRCRQCTFSKEHEFVADNVISAVKANSLQTTRR
jgi:hypothetical protein